MQIILSGAWNEKSGRSNQLLNGNAPNKEKMLIIASNINVSFLHSMRRILFFFVNHQKVVFNFFFLLNNEKYTDSRHTLVNINDSMVHNAMLLQNVLIITAIQV